MIDPHQETNVLAPWPTQERLRALERIIPRNQLQEILAQTGHDQALCKRLPGWCMVWFIKRATQPRGIPGAEGRLRPFEIVYYVMGANYHRYMDIQQARNLGIYPLLHEKCISFAYPTQKLIVRRTPVTPNPTPGAAFRPHSDYNNRTERLDACLATRSVAKILTFAGDGTLAYRGGNHMDEWTRTLG